jgi:hypothetical protein
VLKDVIYDLVICFVESLESIAESKLKIRSPRGYLRVLGVLSVVPTLESKNQGKRTLLERKKETNKTLFPVSCGGLLFLRFRDTMILRRRPGRSRGDARWLPP